MAKKSTGPSMEEYAASKKPKGGVRSVTISKAKNGFVVSSSSDDYSIGGESKEVYESLDGVIGCVKKKLGGSK